MTPRLVIALKKALFIVLPTVAVCTAMLEVGLRLTGRPPSNVTDGIFEGHGAAFRLRPNLTKVSRTPSYTCTIHTNSFGARDRATGPRVLGTAPYVAFLGASETFANGVDYEDSFVGVFAANAARQGVEVVNLAVGGHHLLEQEEILRDFLAGQQRMPSRVVVVFTPLFLHTFEERYTDIFVKNGYLFPRRGWLLPYVTVTLGNSSAAYSFLRDGIRTIQERLRPTGNRAALQALSMYARKPAEAAARESARFEERLQALDVRIRAAGAEPVYVYLPTAIDLRTDDFLALTGAPPASYDFDVFADRVRHHCERSGSRHVDLTAALRAMQATGAPMTFMQDMHYNAALNRVIGDALSTALLGSVAQSVVDGH